MPRTQAPVDMHAPSSSCWWHPSQQKKNIPTRAVLSRRPHAATTEDPEFSMSARTSLLLLLPLPFRHPPPQRPNLGKTLKSVFASRHSSALLAPPHTHPTGPRCHRLLRSQKFPLVCPNCELRTVRIPSCSGGARPHGRALSSIAMAHGSHALPSSRLG